MRLAHEVVTRISSGYLYSTYAFSHRQDAKFVNNSSVRLTITSWLKKILHLLSILLIIHINCNGVHVLHDQHALFDGMDYYFFPGNQQTTFPLKSYSRVDLDLTLLL